MLAARLCPTCYKFFFFSSRRRHTRSDRDWSSDVCSSDLMLLTGHADVDAAIRAVNEAHLFRFLTKPCESAALLAACAAAADQHRLLTAERVQIGRASCRERV